MASIKSLLIEPPGPEVEAAIVNQFWANDLASSQSCHEPYKAYFRYYTTECRRLRLGLSSEVWNSSAMLAITHEHILLIVRILAHETEARRSHVRSLIRQSLQDGDDEAINRSIDFALRVWLTINVREDRLSTPRTPTIQWDETSTLVEFITRIFPRPNPVVAISVQLDHSFTAANMSRLSGIDIEWTPCLADHLRLDKRRRLLRIYPYKQLLCDQLRLWNDVQKVQEKELRFVSRC
jgi:hypothetical protein